MYNVLIMSKNTNKMNNLYIHMDQNTTNINDLPIDSNPPDNRELPESQLNLNRSREIEEPKKSVHFEEKKN